MMKHLNLLKINKHNVFAVISTNIASIRSKYDELQIFTQELLDYDFKFDVICIQESWLGGNDDPLWLHVYFPSENEQFKRWTNNLL